jgi:hypothetical protein
VILFSKIHKTEKKNLWPKQKITCFILLNDKPNYQVSRILMNPRPIFWNRSENDPHKNLLSSVIDVDGLQCP